MKVYEKTGFDTEAALNWVSECVRRECADCPAHKNQKWGYAGARCAIKYLLSDVPELPKVPRWMTAKTLVDFDRLFYGFEKLCKGTYCEDCKYYKIWEKIGNNKKDCYHEYLSELVDAPEDSKYEM